MPSPAADLLPAPLSGLAPASARPAKRTRVAVIGAGGYAQTHLRMLGEIAEAENARVESVVALADTPAAERARLMAAGVRLYPDFESWARAERGEFDLCCLPTPIHLHAPMTRAALEAGGSVLVEKPLAASRADLESLLGAAPRPGRFVAVGFQDLYTPEAQAMRRALARGDYGRIERMTVLGLWPRSDTYYGRNGWAGRLRSPEGGAVLDSPLNNALAHFAMLPLFFAGDPAKDRAAVIEAGEAELYRAWPIESFDTVALRLRLRGGARLQIHLTHVCETEEDPVITLECERATIRWVAWRELDIRWKDGREERRPLPDMWATRRGMFAALCRRSRGEDAWVCPPALAAAHAGLVIALHEQAPIHELPAQSLRAQALPEGRGKVLPGLSDALRRGLVEGKLPGELGCAWAAEATRFAMRAAPIA